MARLIHSELKAFEKQAEKAFKEGEIVGTRLLVQLPENRSMIVALEKASIPMIVERLISMSPINN